MNKFDVTEFLLFFIFFLFLWEKTIFKHKMNICVPLKLLRWQDIASNFKKNSWVGARPQTPLAVLSHVVVLTGLPNIHM
jgi:hypothetical protein